MFPFPILGIDTDNGKEFINATLLEYCQREQLTFTRGRPEVKNDQCYVEEKNGAVVRHFVGSERLEGEGVYVQLREVYRALRLYINCFQPSMKLQAKEVDGERIRRIYDPAKTPLERLLLSGVLSEAQQEGLHTVAQALDPIRLLAHFKELHQALLHQADPAHEAFLVPHSSCHRTPLVPSSLTAGGVERAEPLGLVGHHPRSLRGGLVLHSLAGPGPSRLEQWRSVPGGAASVPQPLSSGTPGHAATPPAADPCASARPDGGGPLPQRSDPGSLL
ncbi:MAG TPA: hypothetical protein VFB12_08850 [Ktedonobacteraceae bacterium]|nr:hypothetical protein [Ktedonobacteraceae bacterium]